MRVAVLGAYGAVGRRLLAEAAARGHAVTAAGRDAERLAQVPANGRVRLGAADTDGLLAVARAHDVIVNATGVEDPRLAATATAGGAAFMDISAEGAYLERLARLECPQRPIVAGIGLAPGLTNLLAATVPGDGPIHIGIVAGVGERHGDAARRWIWDVAGRIVTSSGRTERVYRHVRRMDVPGLGRRRLLRAGFGEQDQLHVDLGRPVPTWLGLDPALATAPLAVAGITPAATGWLDRLSGPLAGRLASHDRWTVVAAGDTTPVAWASGRRQTDATAIVAALCLDPLTTAPPGIYAAHQLVTLGDLRDGLVSAGIAVGVATPRADEDADRGQHGAARTPCSTVRRSLA